MPDAAPGSLAEALIRLQASLPRITKDDTAEVVKDGRRLYSYSYANLAAIHDAVFPLLEACGLYWTCCPTLMDGQFVLDYSLAHTSGASISGQYPLPTSGTPQQVGSAITYARRYVFSSVVGIAPAGDDDDGQSAENAADAWHAPANPRTRKADRHSARRNGPLPDDDWTTTPDGADAPGTITDGQGARIRIRFDQLGIRDRQDRLAYVMSVLDLPELATSKDLSMAQASALIKHMEEDDK